MLGNTPKFKYQSHRFKNELTKAKTYKRGFSPVSENKFIQFLNKNKLLTWQTKLGSFIILVFIIYLLFLPNFLKITVVEISGLDITKTETLSSKVSNYLQKGFLIKHSNLLLLSNKNLQGFLEKQEEVISVKEIKKIFPNKLRINIKPRLEKYSLFCDNEKHIYSNDGKYQKAAATGTTDSNLTKLTLNSPCPPKDYVFENSYLNIFENMPISVFESINTKIAYFEFSLKNDPDIKASLENGSYLLLDSNTYSSELLTNAKTLYHNLSEEEKKKIYYIDLRINNKAFVCFKGNFCTEQTIIRPLLPKNTPTSTQNSTIKPNLSQ